MKDLYWIGAFLSAVFIGYTRAFQRATIFRRKRLAPGNEHLPTGLQDAITPRVQAFRNITVFILLVGLGIAGWALIGWYVAILGPVFAFILAGLLLSQFPKPEFGFYEKKILRSLEKRKAAFEKNGDEARLFASEEVIMRFTAIYPKEGESID